VIRNFKNDNNLTDTAGFTAQVLLIPESDFTELFKLLKQNYLALVRHSCGGVADKLRRASHGELDSRYSTFPMAEKTRLWCGSFKKKMLKCATKIGLCLVKHVVMITLVGISL